MHTSTFLVNECQILTLQQLSFHSDSYHLQFLNIFVVNSIVTPGQPRTPEVNTATKTTMLVEWDKPGVDGGSAVTGYYLERRDKKSLRWIRVYKDPVTDVKQTVYHLTEGNEYQYRVCAINKAGEGPFSDASDFYKAADPVEEAQIDSDVAMRTHYIVKAGKDVELSVPLKGRPAPTASWSKGEECIDRNPKYEFHHSDTATVLVMREVNRLDTGKYTVKIENGVGEPKTLTLSVKVQDTPAQCRNLVMKDVTRGKVTLCWEPPLLDGGAEITNYIVEKRDSSKRSYSAVTSKCTETTYTIEDLSEKTSYFFRVLAENENGVGDPCDTLEPVKATETPGPVKEVSMKDSSKTSVTLQWLKPDYDGGSIISDYVIEKKAQGEEWSLGGTSRQCEFEVKKLKEHSEMFFRVAARNDKGQGDFVETGPIKVIDYIITPEASLAEYPDGTVSVRLGHNVHIELPYKGKPRPAILWLKDNLKIKIFTSSISSQCTHCTHLSNLFPPATPDAPGTPDATEVTGESITLSWTPPTHDGGNPIQYYILEKREKKTVRFYKVMTKKPIVECAHKVLHLTEDMEYEFRVMAVNDAGVGTPSNISIPIKAAEPKDIPCAPSVVCVSDSTNTSISLEWSRPADDGGMEILGYIVEMVKGDATDWKRVNEELVAETNYVVTGLQTGAEYKFRVAAVNHVGRGEEREIPEPAQAVDRLTPPQVDIDASFKQTHIVKAGGSVCLGIHFRGKPIPTATWVKEEGELGVMSEITTTDGYSSLSIENCSRNDTGKYTVNLENSSGTVAFKEVTRGSVTLTWESPHDGGSRIQGYVIEAKPKGTDKWVVVGNTKNLTYVVEKLNKGDEYDFRVKAKNEAGYSKPKETLAPVLVKEPHIEPAADLSEITNQLITCRSGSTFTIDVPISGRPAPKITWKLEEMRLKIFNVTANTMTLKWEEPYNDGGSKVTGYWIEKKERNNILWVRENKIPCFECYYKMENLVEGLEYQFRVYAMNSAGLSKASEASKGAVAQNPVGEF
uniref:Titin n=1 Tax=Lates calcarifer TaxID=8187 RepID=A0A4W6C5J1_LATCA